MEKISDQTRLRPWMGFVLFIAVMVFFIFGAAPLQQNLGIPGLVLTELGFLVIAVIYCLIRRVKIREVFPVKKPKVREVIGAILLVIGMFPLSLIAVAISALIFPWSASEAGDLSSFIYEGMNYPVAVLIVALLPAICEEAIHRGAILSNFRSIKRDWVIVLIMGILFGLNHMSFLRFLTTMLLGIFFSYVVVKRNNILLSVIMHFTNNLISVSLGFLTKDAAAASSSAIDYTQVLGTYLIFGLASPFIITLGLMLVHPEGHKKIRFLFAGIMSAVMLVSGIAVTAVSSAKRQILNVSYGYQVTEEAMEDSSIDFTVDEDRTATVVILIMNAEGNYKVSIDGDSGSNIINAEIPKNKIRMVSYNVDLKADHYKVTVIPDSTAIGEKPQIQITIQ